MRSPTWTVPSSIRAALAELDTLYPARSKAADGTVGDTAHQARESDHNPDGRGVVHAFDVTQDRAAGCDCSQLAGFLVRRRDHRVRYLIWNRQILLGPGSDSVLAGRGTPWVWRRYTGPDPHLGHLHVSIGYNLLAERDTSRWWH